MAFGLGTLGKGIMNAPGMGAIRKPLQAGMKAPGMKPVAKGLGLGPSQPPQQQAGGKMQQMGRAVGQQPMQNAVGQAGAAIGNAFGRPQPQPMQMQAPPLQTPEPSAPASPVDDQNMQAMQNLKQQQMAAMAQNAGQGIGGAFGRGGRIGGGFGDAMAGVGIMNAFGGMGGGQGMMRPQPYQRDMGQQMEQLASPDESFDQQRKNKFQQMRAGGIGPRFGMRQPQIRPEPMQQEEPQQY